MTEELIFSTREEFRKWLTENQDHDPIWLIFGKKGGPKTLHPDEALQEALCFGWIDGLLKSIDESSYKKRFSRRRENSNWSRRNKDFVKNLIADGLMTEFGFKEIEKAKKSGSWDTVEREEITDKQINDFQKLLVGFEPAYTNFLNMPASVKKIYTINYLSAKKEETRIRRLEKIINRLNNNLKPM